MSLFVLQETYAPVLLAHKAKRLRKETGNLELRSRLDQQQLSQQEVVIGTLVRPLRILLTSPIVMLLAIDVAIVYGYQYLVFTTLSYIFQDQYHLSTGLSGLVYLGNGIGTILGIMTPTNSLSPPSLKETRHLHNRPRIRQSHRA